MTIASQWFQTAFGANTPWGHEDTKPLVAIAETALERQLSGSIMQRIGQAFDPPAVPGCLADRAG